GSVKAEIQTAHGIVMRRPVQTLLFVLYVLAIFIPDIQHEVIGFKIAFLIPAFVAGYRRDRVSLEPVSQLGAIGLVLVGCQRSSDGLYGSIGIQREAFGIATGL